MVDLEVYSFMTTEPNELTRSINHGRSPVLLTGPDEWATWLHSPPEAAFALVKPIALGRLRFVQEGFEKNDRGPY